MDKKEKQRIAKKKDMILQALRNAGKYGVTNAELSKIALRYGGHLGKLYEEGYVINKESLGDGLYNYVLIKEPSTIIVREKAINKLISEVSKRGTINSAELIAIMDEINVAVKYKANTYR